MNAVRSFADEPSWSYLRSLAREHDARIVLGTNVSLDERLLPTLEACFPESVILIHNMGEGIVIMVTRS